MMLLIVRSGGRSLSFDCAAIVALCQELGGWSVGIVGKLLGALQQRNLALGLHEWNGEDRIILTMVRGLQRASPSIGRCSVVDVVVVEVVRQGSNSNVLGSDRDVSPDSDFTCEKINFLLFYNKNINDPVLRLPMGFLMNSLYVSSRQCLRCWAGVAWLEEEVLWQRHVNQNPSAQISSSMFNYLYRSVNLFIDIDASWVSYRKDSSAVLTIHQSRSLTVMKMLSCIHKEAHTSFFLNWEPKRPNYSLGHYFRVMDESVWHNWTAFDITSFVCRVLGSWVDLRSQLGTA
jgi:hypothetical protein